MKESAEALKEFLNDFIGHVTPGTVLLGSLFVVFQWPFEVATEVASSVTFLVLAVAACYAAGHAMSALHAAFLPLLKRVSLAVDEAEWERSLETSGAAQRARAALGAENSLEGRSLRSELMTLSPQAKDLAVRFQHVALLYTGVAMALWSASACRVYAYFFSPKLLRLAPTALDLAVQSAVVVLIGAAALWKAKEFHARSLRVPFTAGVAEIKDRNPPSAKQLSEQ